MADPLVVYVDVDDTLIRSAGSKRIPVSGVSDHVRSLAQQGVTLYCWSSAGAEYAQEVATELGLADLFVAFLPKPHVIIDDQNVTAWRTTVQVHPGRCAVLTADHYRRAIAGQSLG